MATLPAQAKARLRLFFVFALLVGGIHGYRGYGDGSLSLWGALAIPILTAGIATGVGFTVFHWAHSRTATPTATKAGSPRP